MMLGMIIHMCTPVSRLQKLFSLEWRNDVVLNLDLVISVPYVSTERMIVLNMRIARRMYFHEKTFSQK
jgi:hypothetical protein